MLRIISYYFLNGTDQLVFVKEEEYVFCEVRTYIVFISTNSALNIYFFYFSNIYIIITPTCFDTVVSSTGSSKVVRR